MMKSKAEMKTTGVLKKKSTNGEEKKRRRFSMKRGEEIMKNRKTGGEFFNLPAGKTRCVVVLPVGDSADFFCTELQRYFVTFKTPRKVEGDKAAKKGTFITSPLTRDQDAFCITSRCYELMKSSASPRMRVLEKRFEPRKQYLMNVFVQEKAADGGYTYTHKIGQFPFSVFEAIWQQICDEMEDSNYNETGDPKDVPIVGSSPRLITISKQGAGMETNYSVTVSGKTIPASKLDMSKVVDLYSVVKITPEDQATQIMLDFFGVESLDELEALASGNGSSDADDDEDDDAPRSKRPAKKQRAVVDDEDEDEEEDEDEGNEPADEEDEAVEDDEDDEDEDEDEEDDAPGGEVPDCFGSYDEKRVKKRGCAECKFRAMCTDMEVEDEEDEDEPAKPATKKKKARA